MMEFCGVIINYCAALTALDVDPDVIDDPCSGRTSAGAVLLWTLDELEDGDKLSLAINA